MTTKPFFSRTVFGFSLRALMICFIAALIGIAALGLDLMNEGRVYQYLWNVTGETEPAQQILGLTQYLTRYTRHQPDTRPFAQIDHTNVNPFGVNTFLEQEVEPEKRERQVQMIADAGFHWIRQQFPWYDIEVHGKGDFEDRRNDLNGDGEKDTISAWIKYDHIVDLAEQYGLNIIVRLSTPPAWSQPPGTTNGFAPPADFQDFVDYAAAVGSRYQGRLQYYQVWNEPNLYPEWGDQNVNAEAYTDLLCRTYQALKEVDPQIVVITGAIGPTIDLSGTNAYDLLYLQRMYQAGAGACFDVLSVQGYGLWSGPTDQRLRQVTINYQRHLWIRDMMVTNGDAHKPIWISEAGWNPVPNDPAIADLDRYGQVTMEQAAEWAPLAYERALKEWPWIGVINYWYFKPADERDIGHSSYYFRMVEPDFTPTPIYDSLKAYITNQEPKTIGAGRHKLPEDVFNQTYSIQGTDIYLCHETLPEAVQLTITIEDRETRTIPAGEAGCIPLAEGLSSGEHQMTLETSGWTGLDNLVILDYSARHRLPWLLVGFVTAAGIGIVLICAVNRRFAG